jgi:hypothetical protein
MLASIVMLTACGGGDGVTPTGSLPASSVPVATPPGTGVQIISGTVASGAPLSGASITIKDSTGATVDGLSGANGTYSIPVTGKKPPFMLVAIKSGQRNLYSILADMDMSTNNTQNVNITPVTTLVIYELNDGLDPASMYTGGSFGMATAANISAKETIVRSKLPANTVNPIFSMMYGGFAAGVYPAGSNPNPYDAALDSLGHIMTISPGSVTFSGGLSYTPSTGTVTAIAAPAISLALTDTSSPYAVKTSLASTSPARVTATVKNANGAAVSGVVVTFSTSDVRDTFTGGVNTAITNNSGIASVTLTTSNTAGGASTVTANATVNGITAGNSLNYSIGASTLNLGSMSLPASLSAYGTASVSVAVLLNGAPYTTPVTVSFTSGCAATGKATLTTHVTTVNGTATASYLDNGCNDQNPGDNITATLSNGATASGNLVVNSPLIGSIQFVSASTTPATTPVMISLKGTGGANHSESARITFRVVDSAGNPLGNALVNFSLNTAPGGLTLSPLSASSDPTTGNVNVTVQSGTMSTPVRVTAATCSNHTSPCTGSLISTQSDQLVISTGIPAQDEFSLSATTHNIEGGDWDGVQTTLTARLADHFRNPVPDGTVVYFTSEGGSITPSCTTVGGACSAVLTSQALRTANGRVTVLARAIGEEAFTDLNSNGVVDPGEMIDANGASTDMGEAYLDYNENGIWDAANEPYYDFNEDGVYTGTTNGTGGTGGTASGDGKYNGVLCNAANTPALCSTQKSIDVRGSQVIVFSTSTARVIINSGQNIVLPSCTVGQVSTPVPFTVTVLDLNGNSMPVGTTVSFSSTAGKISDSGSYVVQDTISCRQGVPGCPVPSDNLGDIHVTMQSDASLVGGVCTYPTLINGTFTVKVTSPKGIITTATATVNN